MRVTVPAYAGAPVGHSTQCTPALRARFSMSSRAWWWAEVVRADEVQRPRALVAQQTRCGVPRKSEMSLGALFSVAPQAKEWQAHSRRDCLRCPTWWATTQMGDYIGTRPRKTYVYMAARSVHERAREEENTVKYIASMCVPWGPYYPVRKLYFIESFSEKHTLFWAGCLQRMGKELCKDCGDVQQAPGPSVEMKARGLRTKCNGKSSTHRRCSKARTGSSGRPCIAIEHRLPKACTPVIDGSPA